MKELVFFESIGIKIDAFTTSRTIAEGTNIEPRKVKDAIRKHQKAFESFGVLASYQAETKNNKAGGRKAVDYLLNEQQSSAWTSTTAYRAASWMHGRRHGWSGLTAIRR